VAVERKDVVLAEGEELDWSFDDLRDAAVGATAALGGKGGEELGVALITDGGVVKGAHETGGRLEGSGRVEVHPKGLEHLSGVALELLPLLRADGARLDLFPMGCLLGVEGKTRH